MPYASSAKSSPTCNPIVPPHGEARFSRSEAGFPCLSGPPQVHKNDHTCSSSNAPDSCVLWNVMSCDPASSSVSPIARNRCITLSPRSLCLMFGCATIEYPARNAIRSRLPSAFPRSNATMQCRRAARNCSCVVYAVPPCCSISRTLR
ncbi:uncharacterized protein TRAVEDRAFT_28427 [Trametes versicolor FP-101664 SS1]|uniref:uncharacterized protein n=1 Tax=Trametes versicolor (strain FP-101664) TaxID=717944 RepID=UPI00046247CA|nr:uncharacterized protein TRAVEDRAFT_28427 [Trametes versicolor FP-101664 SS1]EIW59072.1 hypothetical protein TRAVEDRAFT_28427 [Trametes versicolor FP-101664 SS1]